jgi:hypothetical protein
MKRPAGRVTAECGGAEAETGPVIELVRPLLVPDGFVAPRRLRFGDLVATAISRCDLADDVAGINANLELIARSRGGGWPTGPVTLEENYVDLVWHELEFRENYSYTYVLRRFDGTYVGCAYLYPVGRRVRLRDNPDADVDVSWWLTEPAHIAGLNATTHRALQHWIMSEFPFRHPVYSNADLLT